MHLMTAFSADNSRSFISFCAAGDIFAFLICDIFLTSLRYAFSNCTGSNCSVRSNA
uniref:Uncharacterized protein n=1 Tax=Arundo donax TaxID=35708 RepID=A0A0A9E6T4_ARUDO